MKIPMIIVIAGAIVLTFAMARDLGGGAFEKAKHRISSALKDTLQVDTAGTDNKKTDTGGKEVPDDPTVNEGTAAETRLADVEPNTETEMDGRIKRNISDIRAGTYSGIDEWSHQGALSQEEAATESGDTQRLVKNDRVLAKLQDRLLSIALGK